MSLFFRSGDQSIGVSASASVLPVNIQDWFALVLTDWITSGVPQIALMFIFQSLGLSQIFPLEQELHFWLLLLLQRRFSRV